MSSDAAPHDDAQGSGTNAANQSAASDLISRMAYGGACVVHLPVDEEHGSAPSGEAQVEVFDGRAVRLCPGTYDASTRQLTVQLDEATARSFLDKGAGSGKKPGGVSLGHDLSLGGGGLSYRPNEDTKITVGRKGGNWQVGLKLTF